MRAILIGLLAAAVALASCAKVPPVTRGSRSATMFETSSLRHLIPLPQSVEPAGGDGFTITAETRLLVSPADERVMWIAQYLSDAIGLAAAPVPLRVESASTPISPGAIVLQLGDLPLTGAEAYEVTSTPRGVTIRANQPAGLFYGVQSFRQTLPAFIEFAAVRPQKDRPVVAAPGRIADQPRFSWRGAMLDVSRHFLGVADVKRYIDLLALYKLNRLHLHLADDQGWRIEIKSWPNLTARGGRTQVGGGAGGFYTQEQYVELVRYAAERFITIVPEIDMPGHTNAALASYAELNCDGAARELYTGIEVGFSALCVDKEITYKFIDDVVREMAALTPGEWFHVGGDEVKTLTADQYSRFIERVQTIVRAHGKQTIGWDEISSAPLLPGTIVQHWRPTHSPAAAADKGARVVMSMASKAYLDMKYDETTPIGLTWAGFVDVKTSYDWDPTAMAAPLTEAALLGVEAPLWSETVATIQDVEFLAFPRLTAIAEVGWSRRERDWPAFQDRLGAHGARLTALGVNFFRAPTIPWRP